MRQLYFSLSFTHIYVVHVHMFNILAPIGRLPCTIKAGRAWYSSHMCVCNDVIGKGPEQKDNIFHVVRTALCSMFSVYDICPPLIRYMYM